MKFDIQVDSEHLPYLFLQKGSLDNLKHDRAAWHRAYEGDLEDQYQSICGYLPERCERILDVGSGLGGIDILLRRHYEERALVQPEVALLDGIDDPPEMTLHRKTFNSMRIARNFQVKNGLSPLKFWMYAPDTVQFETTFDLIVSFGSWCFHYPPNYYLNPILTSALKPETILIVDTRKGKVDWHDELAKVFELVTFAAIRPKWQRCVFKVRKDVREKLCAT